MGGEEIKKIRISKEITDSQLKTGKKENQVPVLVSVLFSKQKPFENYKTDGSHFPFFMLYLYE